MDKCTECCPNLIVEITHAIEKTEILYNAAQLRLFDAFERRGVPLSPRDLSRDLSLPEASVDMLERLLSICAKYGLLEKVTSDDNQTLYKNKQVSSLYLTSDSDLSLLTLVDAARHQFDFSELIKRGEIDLSRRWFFDPLENEAAFEKIPHRFRRYYLKQDGYVKTGLSLLRVFDLSFYKRVVDLGGGLGTLCRAFKQFYPEAEVTCVDMPCVLKMAKELDEKSSRKPNIKYLAVDILGEEDLPRADLFIASHLIHMFHDVMVERVLNKIHRALNKGGAVLILEKILDPDRNGPELCLMHDLRVNSSASRGKERTLAEYKLLLGKTGFDTESLKVYVNEGYNCYDAILCKRQ